MSSEQSERVNGFVDFNSFLAWEMASSDTIDLKKIYCDVAGGLNPGLLLSQLLYWRMPSRYNPTKLTINREGRRWLAKADKDWYAEIRLSKEEALTARRILEARNLITCKVWKYAGITTNHISINEPEFLAALAAMINIPEEVRNAGPMNKAVRIGAKRPGSRPRKPTKEPALETGASGDETSGEQIGNTEKSDSRIRKSRIPEYGKVGFPNMENPNSRMRESGIPYTETTTQITSENTAETPSEKNIIIVSNSDQSNEAWDDDDARLFEATATPSESDDSSTELEAEGPFVTDQDGTRPLGGEVVTATSTEQVPAAAAAAPVETVDNRWAVQRLQAIDPEALAARAVREATTHTVLRRAMSCSDVTRLGHMHDQLAFALGATATGQPITRQLYLRLTDQEIEQAIVAARLDATQGVQGFNSLAYFALDALVGYPPSLETLTKTKRRSSSASPGTALGAAYEVKGAAAKAVATPHPDELPAGDFAPGRVWRRKADAAELTFVKLDGMKAHMLGSDGIQVITIVQLTSQCTVLPA
ncbi:hypothetical protein GO986_18805 [Deinococcus sp. HMF7620]|uniref:Uncharacterized protein n=1 Tax=Deinococcus arboris TaxID=2682977 RepID=A0A7C9HTR9_9DEIO|nr:hypothetical protein [Deinococcus arboris]MVN88793.1 hypothetical protein [Deinococcus arboris]